ncbi:MAG: filamentous hemagglutinin N-terminal domain-containing protein [Cyanobacteria bacterium P01_F01_bin.150]
MVSSTCWSNNSLFLGRWAIALPFTLLPITVITSLESGPVLAQIVPDQTLGAEASVVVPNMSINGLDADRIEGGAIRSEVLFHSFDQFNVAEQQGAYFASPVGIERILSRVTGSDVSDIFGTLGVEGTADLFFLNPNGIVFGPNSLLDIGGSFVATTADAFEFGELGTFSARDPESPSPLLTIAPSAFLFGQQPSGEIVNRSTAKVAADGDFPDLAVGLRVPNGEMLLLLGGDVVVDGGRLSAFGGRIEIGSVAGVGSIGVDGEGGLMFPDDVKRGSVRLENDAVLDGALDGGGDIQMQAGIIDVLASVVQTGIRENFEAVGGQAGDIRVDATEQVTVDSASVVTIPNESRFVSGIGNVIEQGAIGNSGRIDIITPILQVLNGGQISSSTFGEGNAGSVTITATQSATVDGTDSIDEEFPSGVFSVVVSGSMGNAGDVSINTPILQVLNGGQISSSAFGEGDAGSVTITTTQSATVDGTSSGGAISSGVSSDVISGAMGNAGSVSINTPILQILNGGQIRSSTFEEGDAGNVTIIATQSTTIDGTSSSGAFSSGVFSEVVSGATGNAGSVSVNTPVLNISDGGEISSSTFGEGDAGSVTITATQSATVDGTNAIDEELDSGVFSVVASGAMGNAGDVSINTPILQVLNGGQISASTLGEGDAGSVAITATQSTTVDGTFSSGAFPSGVFSTVEAGATGNAGSISVNTPVLNISNGGQIISSTFGEGNAGSVTITATQSTTVDGASSSGAFPSGVLSDVEAEAMGNAGSVSVNTPVLNILNGGQISSSTLGEGDAGNVTIIATQSTIVDGTSSSGTFSSGVSSAVETGSMGNAGSVSVNTPVLNILNGGQISSSTLGEGDAGNVTIIATQSTTVDGTSSSGAFPSGVFSTVEAGAVGNAGNVSVNTPVLNISNSGRISSSTLGEGDAGSVIITATQSATIDGTDGFADIFSLVDSDAIGDGGSIRIMTPLLNIQNGASISAENLNDRDGGDIVIAAKVVNLENQSRILASSESGSGGDIIFTGLETLTVNNHGQIAAATNTGVAGRIDIVASDTVHLSNHSQLSVETGIESAVSPNRTRFAPVRTEDNTFIPKGGDIAITSDRLIVEGNSDILVSSPNGQAGNIDINARLVHLDEGEFRATTNANAPDRDSATITLSGLDLLAVTNDSLISAEAFAAADGGNVIINAEDGFIAAPANANSDLIANAIGGNGGNISINAVQIFGLALNSGEIEVLRANQTNDLSVSSQLGIDGAVVIETLGIDPSRGLGELPGEVVDAPPLDAVCSANSQRQSQFIQAGRGGLPTTPTDPFNGSTPSTPWVIRPTPESAQSTPPAPLTQSPTPHLPTLTEAQGWATHPNGTITLIATHPQTTPQESDQPPQGVCHP